jgi:catechol 2,3-dioxygenase-like lactoylglutathione lyase family enzyme
VKKYAFKFLRLPALIIVLVGAAFGSSAHTDELPEIDGAFFALSVRNIDSAVAWYTKHLGFEVKSRGGNAERRGALLVRPGSILELGEFSSATARGELRPGLESHEVYGMFKLGFTTAKLDEWYAYVEARDVEIFFPIVTASDGNRTFGIRDLDGNIIQFLGK